MVRGVRQTIAFVVVLVLAVTVAFADRLVWRPREDPPARADAVVVLGGGGWLQRLAYGRELALTQGVPLALSVPTLTDPDCRPGPAYPRTPICFRPEPFTTQGEARWTAAAQKAHGWRSVNVVLTVDQVARARVRMTRCHVAGLHLAAAPTSDLHLLAKTPYELAAFVKAEVLQRGC